MKSFSMGQQHIYQKHCLKFVTAKRQCCGGGQVVSVLALYSNDPSSNTAEAYSFFN